MVNRKSEEDKLKELEQKIEQMKAKKQQMASRLKEKERKARTKRLIEIGAIFEKSFGLTSKEEAEKYAIGLRGTAKKYKEQILAINVELEKSKIENQNQPEKVAENEKEYQISNT